MKAQDENQNKDSDTEDEDQNNPNLEGAEPTKEEIETALKYQATKQAEAEKIRNY